MRARHLAALAFAVAVGTAVSASAQVTVGPYFTVIFDNSGSMTSSTGGGTNSCGLPRNRMSDAKCVLQDVVNGYGEATFALERFRHSCSGSCSSSTCSTTCGCSCSLTCNSTANAGEVLVPIASGNQSDVLEWVDYSCNSCTSLTPGTQPELHASGNTPLAGALRAAREYYQGLDPRFGTSPIATDSFSGCRPYYVILLTDGDETCGGNPATAATELRNTNVGGTLYDIRTFVIGFGITPGDADTEAIATAGGTDAPGSNRAFYASDETSLALAFSQIMADSILYETCNGVDDDCDMAIDEGYTLYCDRPGGTPPPPTLCTDPGETVCDGIDDNCNGSVDEGLLNACGTCGAAPTETCNASDDDCDGIIDEGGVCMGCVPGPELCDGLDNDCDMAVDESLTRPCGTNTGVCTTGTETCSAGAWGACSGIGPSPEVCDNLDNDCDGVVDGFSRSCGSGVGECRPGSQVCTAGMFGSCSGATGPSAELCDTRDNDCDGTTDEGNPGGGGACGSSIGECSPGTRTCMGGALVCTGGTSPGPETCDGLDEDCDGATDEGVPTMGSCGSSTGACSPGVLTCTGGGFSCQGGVGPSAETCNGIDDDCDGATDEGNPGGGGTCGTSTGACMTGTLTCSGGALSCVGGVNPSAETCDGVDEDCDGLTDEGNPGGGAVCGSSTGACVPGTQTCTAGALVCTGGVGPSAETCNASDDDCDGFIDEGNPGGGGTCGTSTGACSPGTRTCVSGALTCTGGVGPTSETCNAADDDCDGATDEGNPGGGGSCGSSVGVCMPGTLACSGGALTCGGGTGPSAETCDALDNDCDGVVDEGNPGGGAACGTTTGECSPGSLTCSGGALSCVGATGPSAEICDGRDNDCDASTDEGNPGGGGSCGSSIGACMPGTLSCSGGSLTCTGGVSPTSETCNSADDDCDGNTDESVPTMGACGVATGECDTGVLTCVSGGFTCVGDRGPTTEVCDSRDNDCDGSTDEGNPGGGAACGTSTGECMEGMSECVGGALTCVGGTSPMPETCDSLDNDCDGLIDEGNPGGGGSCGTTDVGVCEFGAEACSMGMLVCVGETGPSAELCDGLDNDCDEVVDEGDPEGGMACGDGTGECMPGVTACTGGMLVCMGAVGPTPEVCDGLDNDCDGVPDDGLSIGAPCGTDVGECSPGAFVCRGGALVCEGAIDPIAEECDALDNDCDGAVDEMLPLGGPCGSDEGECMAGMEMCVRGRVVCTGEVPPGRETCDCADNDCDGMVDETPTMGALCPAPSACVDCQCALDCMPSEFGFTCPTGRTPFMDGDRCFCVAERCNDATCGMETLERDGTVLCAPDAEGVTSCVCKNNECTFPCDGVVCMDGTVCDPNDPRGVCVEDSCRGLGCPGGEICNASTGLCEADPCEGVMCADGEACREGVCERSCADVECDDGEICTGGVCAPDPCVDVSCGADEVCDPSTGMCAPDLCVDVSCPMGTLCEPLSGECVADPCETLRCPDDEICEMGECVPDPTALPDAGPGRVDSGGGFDAGRPEDPEDRVLAAGGCMCRATGGGSSSSGGWLALLLLGAVFLRRRRRRGSKGLGKGAAAAAAVAALLFASGCDVDPFCLTCGDEIVDAGDAGEPMDAAPMDATVDSGTDAGFERPDACVPEAMETCNEFDDDCDELIDEDFDLTTDINHCGGCGMGCAPPHAFGECVDAMCGIASCDVGWHDLDMDPDNGCEYRCLASETDDAICDLRDNDCDGVVDEDVAFDTDPENCGVCGRSCRFAHATAGCDMGTCTVASCDMGFTDLDGVLDNGCEYACTASTPPDEICDGRDDDCDGTVDEGDPGGGGACGSSVGECTTGTEACTSGAITCMGATSPTTELCNGLDDDCDGMTDEGNPEGGRLCGTGTGTCDQGREQCMGGALVCTGETGPTAELCNGLDDDCDGTIDEGDPGGGGSCGTSTGRCMAGLEHCRGGVVVCEGATGPIAETCDGVDQDCDGTVDEGNPGGGGSCGTDVGTCSPGVRTCTAGALVCTGSTGAGPETCDSLDNDCDGSIDEGNPDGGASCGLTTGECSGGTQVCLAGTLQCQGGTGPGTESCNGLDDDCDGATDEGNPGGGAACGSSAGECTSGTQMCMGGGLTCVGGSGPAPEVCNGLDDDCDGNVDEGNPGGGATCGSSAGSCSPGTLSCIAGALQCQGGSGPSTELCNAVDDDCDGMTDEGNPEGGASCGSSIGACSPGTTTCSGGALTCSGGTSPVSESCNSTDDDCDGNVDEGNPGGGASCGTSTGACSAGTQTCIGGAFMCTGGSGPSSEVCDGVDNDCDGNVDEGNPGGGGSCGIDTGSCSFGTIMCSGGALMCAGGTGPTSESCNSVDDDCDGSVDEGNPGGGGLCGSDVGQCSAGTRVCTAGTLVCTGATGPGSETCNGLDDDCDSNIDEGNPGGGASCGSSTGSCTQGTQTCLGGALQCTGGTGPSPESCNMADDDCDMSTDEDFDFMNDRNNCGGCGTVCSFPNASAGCSGGSCVFLGCDPGFVDVDGDPMNGCEYMCSFAGAEACNGRDDDCDMAVDEALTPPATFCNANGVCAGTSATCGGMSGWTCSYPATYETPESTCDSLDNDCDGAVDEAFPTVGNACANGVGECRRTGSIVCNGPGTGTTCNAPPAGAPGVESCNGLDDDCDGSLDEGGLGTWVPITGPFGTSYMMAYEASRPDATSFSTGSMSHTACSSPNRQPWTNLTQPEAEAACAAAGGRLCTEQEWQTGCESTTTMCDWSYASSCSTYQSMVCNDVNYDFDPGTPGDQNGMLATASLPMCYAGWSGGDRIYDMSGNAEEWTAARQPGINPLRGGSNNDTSGGTRCDFDFIVADDTIRLPTVGFRCCRSTPLTCDNGVFDGDETDLDCGGSCDGCVDGASCMLGSDCTSGICSGGICQVPTCSDGVTNGGETDTDCGGATACPRCPTGDSCGVDADCASGSCLGGVCRDFSCTTVFGTDGYGYVGCEDTPAVLPCDDIRSTGTATGVSDDGTATVSIGFSFDFYGTAYTGLTVQANGAVTFETGGIGFNNTCLPKGGNPDVLIAPFWDDLNPSNGGSEVYYQTLGSAPNRRFVVQWSTEHYNSTPSRADVRMVLREGSNDIDVCYVDTDFGNASFDFGLSATAGISDPAVDTLQYSCGGAVLTNGLLLEYHHP